MATRRPPAWVIGALGACALSGLWPVAAAEDRLPDLIARPELLHQTEIDRLTLLDRELLRLTSGTANIGTGPLEVRGGAILDAEHREVLQRIYRSDGTSFDRLAGLFTYHPGHGHVHFDEWNVFRLRETLPGGGVGGVVAQGRKVSFCLLDGTVYDPTNPFFVPRETYGACGFDVQGISPGWGDIYGSFLPDQWIDITGVPDGLYWLEIEVDPDDRVIEADETNNLARVPIRLRPPEARPDRFEENDAFDEVAALPEGAPGSPNLGRIDAPGIVDGLSLEDAQDIFAFRLGAPAGPGGFVRIESPWSAGDLDLALYDADRIQVAASAGPASAERIALEGLEAGLWFVVVTSRAGANPEYRLTIDPGGTRCIAGVEDAAGDADGDGVADDCDNCPAIANEGQADANRDGAGDACQASLTLDGIVADGGESLEVRATTRDPLGGTLTGHLVLSGPWRRPLELHDAFAETDCGLAFLPDGEPGRGIAFTVEPAGEPYLFDLDSVMGCDDGEADYQVAAGPCPQSITSFDRVLPLAGLALPGAVCLRREGQHAGGTTIVVESYDDHALHGRIDAFADPLLDVPFSGGLPRRIPLASMAIGGTYDLEIDVTNGVAPPVRAGASFIYAGEPSLVINTPPRAAIAAAAVVECDRPGAGPVALDGSASNDPDAPPVGGDELVRFEWFEALGTPQERRLGEGVRLDAVLPLGTHLISLRVTDSIGEVDRAEAIVEVRDTTAPILRIAVEPAMLQPPDHRLAPIGVSFVVDDRCDPEARVALLSAASSEPDDAPGAGDGATTGDIQAPAGGIVDRLLLRAERAGSGPGRTYTLTFAAVDRSGNSGTAKAEVRVPHH